MKRSANAGTVKPADVSPAEPVVYCMIIKDSVQLFLRATPYINFVKSGCMKDELPLEKRREILAAVRLWDDAVSFLSEASISCRRLGLFLESRILGDEVEDTLMRVVYEIWAAQLALNITPDEGVSAFVMGSKEGSIYGIVDAFAQRTRSSLASPLPFEQRVH